MIKAKIWKWLLIAVALSLLSVIALWLLLPLWAPLVLPHLAEKLGAHYQSYKAQGLRRFSLTDLNFTNSSIRVQADHVTALAPNAWAFGLLRHRATSAAPFLQASGWSLTVLTNSNPSSAPSSTYTNALRLGSLVQTLRRWVPVATLSNGQVEAPGFSLTTSQSSWSNGVLRTDARLESWTNRIQLTADFQSLPHVALQAEVPSLKAVAEASAAALPTGFKISAKGSWYDNPFLLNAEFPKNGALLERASFSFNGFELPANALNAEPYASISGSLNLSWQQPEFALGLQAKALPEPGETRFPPATVSLQAHGNTNAAIIESALISSPWLSAQLSSNLTVHFTGPYLREPAYASVTAVLTNQPWLPLKGSLHGDAQFTPGDQVYPRVDFQLAGTNVGLPQLQTEKLGLRGDFEWPFLRLRSFNAELGSNTIVSANATVDLAQLRIAKGNVSFRGLPPGKYVPAGWSLSNISASVRVKGPVKRPEHEGELYVQELQGPSLQALDISAKWSGQFLDLTTLHAEVDAARAKLRLSGSAQVTNASIVAEIGTLSLQESNEVALSLAQPFRVTALRAGTNMLLSVGPLEWSGPNAGLNLDASMNWPLQGAVKIVAKEVNSSLLAPFLQMPLHGVMLHSLDAEATWTNSPVQGYLSASLAALLPSPAPTTTPSASNSIPANFTVSLQASEQGLAISNLTVSTKGSPAVEARGFLPFLLRTATRNVLDIRKQENLEISARVRPDAFFWAELTRAIGWEIVNPRLGLTLSGTWESPKGELQLAAAALRPPATTTGLPALSDLSLQLDLSHQEAVLTNIQVLVQGVPFLFTAQVPLGERFWDSLAKGNKPPFSLQKASAHLTVEHGNFTPLAELFPKLLAPQGELNVDLQLRPGGELAGEFSLLRVRTRPIGNLGPVRDIYLHTRFEGTTAQAVATASIGGSTVSLTGGASLADNDWLQGQMPPLQFSLTGTNVPLARNPNAIIRSDLSLSILKTNGASPLISGKVVLTNSFFLSDLRALVPGKVSAPSRRPPYFSIDDPVLSDWRLDLRVTGQKFLKVRSPIFAGAASADLQLHGTLKDPIATGDVRLPLGTIRFPFASFDIQQGFVSLSPQNPFHPQLSITASARQFGYDVNLEVSGPADAPVVQLSSSPPLSAEQILLMVTAGQAPREQQVFSTQQRAQTAAVFLGRDLLTQLGLTDNAQERLTIRSGEQLSENGSPTYNIEYKLSPNLSLTGEYDRFNDFNAGLKWRFYSK